MTLTAARVRKKKKRAKRKPPNSPRIRNEFPPEVVGSKPYGLSMPREGLVDSLGDSGCRPSGKVGRPLKGPREGDSLQVVRDQRCDRFTISQNSIFSCARNAKAAFRLKMGPRPKQGCTPKSGQPTSQLAARRRGAAAAAFGSTFCKNEVGGDGVIETGSSKRGIGRDDGNGDCLRLA